MIKTSPRNLTKQNIIALAQTTYGETSHVAIAKAAAEALYDPSVGSKENIQIVCTHLQQFPYGNPEEIAQKAYGFAKKKNEADVLKELRKGFCEHQHLDGSKAPRKMPASSNCKAMPMQEAESNEGVKQKSIRSRVSAVRPQEGLKKKREEPVPTVLDRVTYRIKNGLTSLGITAESTYKISSTQGKALLIKKAGGLSPRLDSKKKEVRIVSGLGLLEGTISNGDFVKDGCATIISKNGREVYVVDLPEKVAILLPTHKKTQLKSSVAKKLATYIQCVKNPTSMNIIAAVKRCSADFSVKSNVNLSVDLKLMIFPVSTKNKIP